MSRKTRRFVNQTDSSRSYSTSEPSTTSAIAIMSEVWNSVVHSADGGKETEAGSESESESEPTLSCMA